MKFMLIKANDDDFKEEIEINTIEDLKRLQDKYQHELIIDFYGYDDENECNCHTIEIYNDYRE